MDPFTGVWRFRPEPSSLAAPPKIWTQEILSADGIVVVRERVVRGGKETLLEVRARFDGAEYPCPVCWW